MKVRELMLLMQLDDPEGEIVQGHIRIEEVSGRIITHILVPGTQDWRGPRKPGDGPPVPNGIPIEVMQRDGKKTTGSFFSPSTWRFDTGFPEEDILWWRPVKDIA